MKMVKKIAALTCGAVLLLGGLGLAACNEEGSGGEPALTEKPSIPSGVNLEPVTDEEGTRAAIAAINSAYNSYSHDASDLTLEFYYSEEITNEGSYPEYSTGGEEYSNVKIM